MALSKEAIENKTRIVVGLYLDLETQLLDNIFRRVSKDIPTRTNDIARWQTDRLAELDALNRENVRLIANRASIPIAEVEQSLKAVNDQVIIGNESVFKQASKAGAELNTVVPHEESQAMLGVLDSFVNKANSEYNLVNGRMLGSSRNVYLDIINTTTSQVLTGVTDANTAIRRVSRKWANQGISAFVDSAGRSWSTEAYASTIIRSNAVTMQFDLLTTRMGEYGSDLIAISSHNGARPRCAPYQGKAYSLSGTHRKFPPFSTTSYGKAAGIFGINCGHSGSPYFPGISKLTKPEQTSKENSETYRESQVQRRIERRIRHAKRELLAMEYLGDQQGIDSAKAKIRRGQAQMRSFINQTGRTRRYQREQIYD